MTIRQHGPGVGPGVGSGKAATGIRGLDASTGGGLPQGRTTLVEGGPGSGKTVLALQSLVHAARALGEPAIFVAFEEDSASIVANASRFGWDLEQLKSDRLFFLDARPSHDLVSSGGIDLDGLLAGLDAKVREIGARRIAIDAIDVVLHLLDDAAAERRELYRLHDWLLARGLTAVITCKSGAAGAGRQANDFLQFMGECALVLEHRVVDGVSQRSLRVRKYRGSGFNENESPLVIGAGGMEVASIDSSNQAHALVTSERVSCGVPRLDTMLGGGIFRGASVLLTGAPGTAKTTLCGAFAQAACERGEPTVYVSFDSAADEVVRNLRSVGLRLDRYLPRGRRPGLLRMAYLRAVVGSAETQLLEIQALARAHGARCVVVDPVSALAKLGQGHSGHGVAERLIDWAKIEGITLMCSSLLDGSAPEQESTPLQISTIADTWIHLHYQVRGGERNRGLSIVKSRGTAHSNQVRELLLSDGDITLADAYAAGGEVLMGTLRWEREQADAAAARAAELQEQQARIRLLAEESELQARLNELQRQIDIRRVSLQALGHDGVKRRAVASGDVQSRRSRRGADAEAPARQPRKRQAP
jgi:circadian clock protein KaiC